MFILDINDIKMLQWMEIGDTFALVHGWESLELVGMKGTILILICVGTDEYKIIVIIITHKVLHSSVGYLQYSRRILHMQASLFYKT